MIVTLTPQATPPAVHIDVSGLPAATATLSVLRILTATITDALSVRGAATSVVGTTAAVTDWDAPTGVEVGYRFTALAVDGSILDQLETNTGPIPDLPDSQGWLSDPLDARSQIAVPLRIGTGEELTATVQADFARVAGSALARANYGTRRAPIMPVEMCTRGDLTSRVRQLVMASPSLLLRPPGCSGLVPLVYGVSPDVTETPIRPGGDHSHWTMQITPTRGPGRQMMAGAWTYGDIVALGLTYGQLFQAYGLPPGAYGSYRDLMRAPL